MKHLAEFEKYLIGLGIVRPEQIDCAMEDGRLDMCGEDLGDGQVKITEVDYTATYWIERFTDDAPRLLAHLACYLSTLDIDANDLETELDIERLEEGVVNIEIKLTFKESITLAQDPDGEFEYNGDTYSLSIPTVNVAESGEVKHA